MRPGDEAIDCKVRELWSIDFCSVLLMKFHFLLIISCSIDWKTKEMCGRKDYWSGLNGYRIRVKVGVRL